MNGDLDALDAGIAGGGAGEGGQLVKGFGRRQAAIRRYRKDRCRGRRIIGNRNSSSRWDREGGGAEFGVVGIIGRTRNDEVLAAGGQGVL